MTLNTLPVPIAAKVSPNSYLATLEAAWQQHLAPRASDAPTVISLFAGCGGSSLGYSMAGYRELLAVEWDDNAVQTFRLNFPGMPVYHGDIAQLTVEQCLELAQIGPEQLDVLDGSPPCQGFSTAGKRMMDDPRNQLFNEYVRLLRGLRPKVFVMENVSGMIKGKMKLIFVDILRALKESGYQVRAALLNAMYFNVPQSRERLIFIGIRQDLGIEPNFPKAQSRGITFREAQTDLENHDIRSLGDIVTRYARVHPRDLWSTKSEVWHSIKGNYGSSLSLKWASWDKPIQTLIKDERALCGIVHPDRDRYLSISEMRRCTSFPDEFVFLGDRDECRMRIGNSVPPLFMRAIAQHIRETILERLAGMGLDPRLSEQLSSIKSDA